MAKPAAPSLPSAGSDVFVGMNPIKDGAYTRTKPNVKDIRHVYLDLDRTGDEALQAIRNSVEVPAPNFVLVTSPGKHQVVWKVSGLPSMRFVRKFITASWILMRWTMPMA